MTIKYLEVEELDIAQEGVTVVDFYADWCGPCRMLNPALEEVSTEENVSVVKVNTDKLPKLAAEHQIRSIPHLHFYKNGELAGTHTGVISTDDLKAKIADL